MNKEEMLNQIGQLGKSLNTEGLGIIHRIMSGMDGIELYSAKTTPERIAEIKAEEVREKEERKAKYDEDFFEQMYERVDRRKDEIAALTGSDRKFYGKIQQVYKMGISRYNMSYRQMMLLRKLYDDNFTDACGDTFCYGFYQGMRYIKNQERRKS